MGQPTILQLSRAGFTEAKRLLGRKGKGEWALIACALVALFDDGTLAYWLSLAALGLQVFAWIARHRGLGMHTLAERAKRQALLIDGLGSSETNLELADLRSDFSRAVTTAATTVDAKGYYFSSETPGSARLREHILESAFWSKDLYGKAGKRALIAAGVLLAAIVAALLISVPQASTDTLLLVARVLVLLLGSALMLELLGDGFTWLAASRDTTRVFHRAEYGDLDGRHWALALFGDYSAATASAPPIPERVYKRTESHLNEIWASYRTSRERGASA